MKYILKRIVAYVIDIIFVTTIVTLLTSNSYINKDYKKYMEKYDEYNRIEKKYKEFSKDLDNFYKDSVLSKKEYNKIDQKDYKEYLKKYQNKKINKKEIKKVKENSYNKYVNISNDYSYEIRKSSVISSVISILFILLYFVIVQYFFNGQTIGKKLLKLKVVSNNDKELNMFNYLLRSLILNEVFINVLSLIFIITLNKNSYFVYNKIIYVITYVIEMVLIFMVVFDKKHRGLHDYISNTKVIEFK